MGSGRRVRFCWWAGRPLGFVLTPGEAHDVHGFVPALAHDPWQGTAALVQRASRVRPQKTPYNRFIRPELADLGMQHLHVDR